MCEAPGTPCTFAGYSFVGRSCSQYNKLEGYAAAAAAAAIPIGVATAAPTAVPTSELPGALAMARILRRASSRRASSSFNLVYM